MWAVYLPFDILPEDEILLSIFSKFPFGGLEQGLVLISQRNSFLKPGLRASYCGWF